MSAWIVSKHHIDILVTALLKYEIVNAVSPDEIGKILWRENYRSVNYRYGERRRTPKYVHTYRGKDLDFIRKPISLFKAIGCYDYQTCEHKTYGKSQAYEWIQALEEQVVKSSGLTREEIYDSDEYDQAPRFVLLEAVE